MINSMASVLLLPTCSQNQEEEELEASEQQ